MFVKKWKCDTESSKENFVNICPWCSYEETCLFIGICKHQISEYNYKRKENKNGDWKNEEKDITK